MTKIGKILSDTENKNFKTALISSKSVISIDFNGSRKPIRFSLKHPNRPRRLFLVKIVQKSLHSFPLNLLCEKFTKQNQFKSDFDDLYGFGKSKRVPRKLSNYKNGFSLGKLMKSALKVFL